MTNDGWDSKWPNKVEWPTGPAADKVFNENWYISILTGLDLAIGERTILTTFENGELKHKVISQTELKSQGSNLVDDQEYLYYQCEICNDIFDPHTKSFKTLDEKRFAAGWKVKWNIDGMGYKVYCAKCGEKV